MSQYLAVDHAAFLAGYRQQFQPMIQARTLDNLDRFLRCAESDARLAAGSFDLTVRRLAYMTATAYHESGHDFEPRDEYGLGRGKGYGRPVQIASGQTRIYYGRGLVQLTWHDNYVRAERELNVPFVAQPELAKAWPHCYDILSGGMHAGWFTGRRLAQFINHKIFDYIEARTIINGHDKADLIAGYAIRFERILRRSAGLAEVPVQLAG